jgi:hypothetical protein
MDVKLEGGSIAEIVGLAKNHPEKYVIVKITIAKGYYKVGDHLVYPRPKNYKEEKA